MASTVAGGDVMAAIRCQFHRLRAGADSATRREGGSTIFQVFQDRGAVVIDGVPQKLDIGDIFVIPHGHACRCKRKPNSIGSGSPTRRSWKG